MLPYWISGYFPAQLCSGRCLALLGSGRGAVCLRFGAAEEARALPRVLRKFPEEEEASGAVGRTGNPCVQGWRRNRRREKEGVGGRGHLAR